MNDMLTLIGDTHPLLTTLVASIVGGFVGGAAGSILTIFADRIHDYFFHPNLEIGFNQNDENYIARVSMSGISTLLIRLRVVNLDRTIAKGCRAFLAGIDNLDDSGAQTSLRDLNPLAWSARQSKSHADQEYEPIELPKNVEQFLDVVCMTQGSDAFSLSTKLQLLRYQRLFNKRVRFKLKIVVMGDNFAPTIAYFFFTWRGWNRDSSSPNFDIELGEGCVTPTEIAL